MCIGSWIVLCMDLPKLDGNAWSTIKVVIDFLVVTCWSAAFIFYDVKKK